MEQRRGQWLRGRVRWGAFLLALLATVAGRAPAQEEWAACPETRNQVETFYVTRQPPNVGTTPFRITSFRQRDPRVLLGRAWYIPSPVTQRPYIFSPDLWVWTGAGVFVHCVRRRIASLIAVTFFIPQLPVAGLAVRVSPPTDPLPPADEPPPEDPPPEEEEPTWNYAGDEWIYVGYECRGAFGCVSIWSICEVWEQTDSRGQVLAREKRACYTHEEPGGAQQRVPLGAAGADRMQRDPLRAALQSARRPRGPGADRRTARRAPALAG